MTEIEKIINEEIKFAEEDLKKQRKEYDTKQLLLHRGALLNLRNPLDLIISTLDEIDSFTEKGIVVLNEDYVIKGMTRTASRILGYRQKHGNPPCFGKLYTELLYKEDISEFEKRVRERATRIKSNSDFEEYFIQKIVVPHRDGSRVHIKSRVLAYKETRIRSLYGIILGWNKIKIR
ncbi:MAG: hypothetical protein Q8R00_02910 [Candidatus Nanoarchaeia archaeon]|nr:hypothetical protein [Candidatus Nanoarchaeia archaeon]